MFDELGDGGCMVGPSYGNSPKRVVNLPIAKKVELEIAEFEKEISKRKEMLQLLKDNPAIERFMDLSRGL